MSTDKYCDEEGTLTPEQYKTIMEKSEWSLWFGVIAISLSYAATA